MNVFKIISKKNEVTIHYYKNYTHADPFAMHWVGFRAFKSPPIFKNVIRKADQKRCKIQPLDSLIDK